MRNVRLYQTSDFPFTLIRWNASIISTIIDFQLDLNCMIELGQDGVFLLGAEEGLFSYRINQSTTLTKIQGVVRVHQLSLHPHIGLALMIAGDDRELVACDLRQLKSNALAAECSRPAIKVVPILTSSDSCHLYQIKDDLLCAATASHVT